MSALRAFLTPPLLAAITSSVVFAGCVDPGKRLTDFEGEVVDAAPLNIPDGEVLDEIPDIGGTWYVVFLPVPTPDVPIHTLWTATFTRNADGTAKVNIISNPLTRDTHTLVTGSPFTLPEASINKAGEYTLKGTGMPLPAGTSALDIPIKVDLELNTRIKSKDFMCGVMVKGQVQAPQVPLDGTPFAAQRVEPGTDGADLPAAITECPPDLPDAGVPDAAPIDAGNPDAGIDAGASDAA